VALTENLLGELQSRDEANDQLTTELEGSKEDVDRMMEELKNKEQEHAGETAELVNKNSELTEMLDDTMEKLDTAQKELEEQASRLSESEVGGPFIHADRSSCMVRLRTQCVQWTKRRTDKRTLRKNRRRCWRVKRKNKIGENAKEDVKKTPAEYDP